MSTSRDYRIVKLNGVLYKYDIGKEMFEIKQDPSSPWESLQISQIIHRVPHRVITTLKELVDNDKSIDSNERLAKGKRFIRIVQNAQRLDMEENGMTPQQQVDGVVEEIREKKTETNDSPEWLQRRVAPPSPPAGTAGTSKPSFFSSLLAPFRTKKRKRRASRPKQVVRSFQPNYPPGYRETKDDIIKRYEKQGIHLDDVQFAEGDVVPISVERYDNKIEFYETDAEQSSSSETSSGTSSDTSEGTSSDTSENEDSVIYERTIVPVVIDSTPSSPELIEEEPSPSPKRRKTAYLNEGNEEAEEVASIRTELSSAEAERKYDELEREMKNVRKIRKKKRLRDVQSMLRNVGDTSYTKSVTRELMEAYKNGEITKEELEQELDFLQDEVQFDDESSKAQYEKDLKKTMRELEQKKLQSLESSPLSSPDLSLDLSDLSSNESTASPNPSIIERIKRFVRPSKPPRRIIQPTLIDVPSEPQRRIIQPTLIEVPESSSPPLQRRRYKKRRPSQKTTPRKPKNHRRRLKKKKE